MEFSWKTHGNSPSRKQWSSPDNPDVCARVYSRGVSGQIEWELLFTNFPTRALYSCTVGSFCMHVAGSVLRMMRMSNVKFCCVVFPFTSHLSHWSSSMFHRCSMSFHDALSCPTTDIACQALSWKATRIRDPVSGTSPRKEVRMLSSFPVRQSGRLPRSALHAHAWLKPSSFAVQPLFQTGPDNPARPWLAVEKRRVVVSPLTFVDHTISC